jgi:hypothetical protein
MSSESSPDVAGAKYSDLNGVHVTNLIRRAA